MTAREGGQAISNVPQDAVSRNLMIRQVGLSPSADFVKHRSVVSD